jgi:hypothetical protein
MLKIADIIFATCKTYLIQQGRFLLMLFAIIGSAMTYYFMGLQHETFGTALLVLFFSVVGMAGSYAVGLVRHPGQHLRQLPDRLRGPAREAVGRGLDPPPRGHVDRPLPDLARAGDDGHHPALPPAQHRRLLLPRLRDRRVAGRLGAPHRGRHLHEDRRTSAPTS